MQETEQILRRLIPICHLTEQNFSQLMGETAVQTLPAGDTLFAAGDADARTYYLLNGELELTAESGESSLLSSGAKQALFPLAHKQPRQETAKALTDIVYIGIDNSMIDGLLARDQAQTLMTEEVADEADAEGDWMTGILQSRLFQRVPPANIQKMFLRLEQVSFTDGEVVVQQGDRGDYYYIVQRGQCEVSRQSPDGKQHIRLATLKVGDSFGEEALISDVVRNATVTMKGDGSLMRLSSSDFKELLKQPVVSVIPYAEACEQVEQGAVWLDVRLENEHAANAIPGSLNLPLYLLRVRMARLNPETRYIVFCDAGARSETAAYLLSEKGFDVQVLAGGLVAMQQPEAEIAS